MAGGGISPALTLYGWGLYGMTGCLLVGVCRMGLPDGGRGEGTILFVEGKVRGSLMWLVVCTVLVGCRMDVLASSACDEHDV